MAFPIPYLYLSVTDSGRRKNYHWAMVRATIYGYPSQLTASYSLDCNMNLLHIVGFLLLRFCYTFIVFALC